ncbi:hypothetical protein D3C83_11400 [compost metagenome]
MELDALAQLEGIGEPVPGNGPRFGKIALDGGIFLGVEFEQRGTMRPHRVDEGE